MLRKVWRDELDSHLLDCADELMVLGYDRESALAEAKKQFGDTAKIQKELEHIHPWLAVYADWIALGLLLLTILPLYALHYFATSSALSLVSEQLLLWWYGGALVLITAVLLKWQFTIVPLTKRLSLCIALSIGWFIAACVTVGLDPNNFETIIYNGLFALTCVVLLAVLWKPLALWQRQLFLLVAIGLMILFAWREEGFGERAIFQQCLYLIDNNPYAIPPVNCEHVSLLSGYFWFIYAGIALALGYIVPYLIQLWQQGTKVYRQVITTGTLVLLPIVAFSVSGINSTGALDVVPWKTEIYQSYLDILGRRPEEKDYQFYGSTRAYQHMSQVRSVLYASPERREKIKLLYQEILGRNPSEQELNNYFDSTLTIKQITQELQRWSVDTVRSAILTMIPRNIMYKITYLLGCVGIIAICWWAATDDATQRTQQHAVLTRIVPTMIEGVNVYPTDHAVIPLDPTQEYQWQNIHLSEQLATGEYYLELWDAHNEPIPGFKATRLTNETIHLASIDATLTPSLRAVIFQPSTAPAVPAEYVVTISYREYPNQRLFVLLGLALLIGWTILLWSFLERKQLPYLLVAISNLLHGQFISPYLATLCTVIFAGIFGAVLGSFIGGIQIAYVLIKLPFLMGATLVISFTTLLLLSWLSGVKASVSEIWRVALNLLAITALGLCSLSTILLFYIFYPLNHDQVLIATIGFFIGSGVLALMSLYRWQRKVLLPIVWLMVYGLVFMQLGWLLRPWVGVIDPVHQTVPIARPNSGNVFSELMHTLERLD